MIDFWSAVLGAIGFLILLGGGYWVLLKTTSLGETDDDTESTDDRLTMDVNERHHRVGFRHRVSRQTPMTKAFLASIVVLLIYLMVAMYQVAATGAPTEAVYAEYVELGVFGLICVAGGVWFKAKQDRKAGELQIMYEKDEGNRRETVKFDRSRMIRETDDGTALVPELKGSQVFGLFWRPLLVADDPELRDSDHRLPDDLVLWEIPDDESAVWNERTGEVTIRARDKNTIDNPNRVADYEIVPSQRKSKTEIQRLENDINELESELKSERVQNAILSENLTEIENILTNEEHHSLQRIKEAKEALRDDDREHRYHYDDREPGRSRERPPAQRS